MGQDFFGIQYLDELLLGEETVAVVVQRVEQLPGPLPCNWGSGRTRTRLRRAQNRDRLLFSLKKSNSGVYLDPEN